MTPADLDEYEQRCNRYVWIERDITLALIAALREAWADIERLKGKAETGGGE